MITTKTLGFLAAVLASSLALAEAGSSAATGDPNHTVVSSVPRFVRDNPVPEVFFVETSGQKSLVISTASGEAYNRVMEAVNVGIRTRSAVRLVVDRKSGVIVDTDGTKTASKSTSIYDDSSDDDLISSPSTKAVQSAPPSGKASAVTPAGATTSPGPR